MSDTIFHCEKCGSVENVSLVACEGLYCWDCEIGMLEQQASDQMRENNGRETLQNN